MATIRITNETHWSTRDLRRFIARCAKQEGIAVADVRIVYNRQVRGVCTGHAWYNSTHSVIKVPSQEIDPIDLAMVIAHEFAHNKNVRHRQMTGDPYYRRTPRTTEVYAWANDLPLTKVEPKKRQRPAASDKLAHAQEMLSTWQSKLKRTTTMYKKWRRKVKYYDNRIAAMKAKG